MCRRQRSATRTWERSRLEPVTHTEINHKLCGEPQELREGYARVKLRISRKMSADDRGLAHGGFVFSLADYAAMLAVNHPNVVLGNAQMRFLRPTLVGDILTAEAVVHDQEGKKKVVIVDVLRANQAIARGEFICFTPDEHVLGEPQ